MVLEMSSGQMLNPADYSPLEWDALMYWVNRERAYERLHMMNMAKLKAAFTKED